MLWEPIRPALQSILRDAMQWVLTVLGMVIGVAAVIAMVTVGQGSTLQMTRDVAKLGANLLMVRPGQDQRGPSTAGIGVTMKDVAAIQAQRRGVRATAPANSRAMTRDPVG
jgi:putative ABC transport system permease protein